jgi:hypothetical protein
MGRTSVNAQVTIIEPETLEYLPAKTLLRLVEQSQKTAKNAKAFRLAVSTFPDLFRTFEELDLTVAFNLDNEYMNLSFAGDGEKLKTVWGHMRRAGFNTRQRPAKGDTTFNAFWSQEGYADIFMMFSSTMCRRVKIGTKMVEQVIYETQCGELPEIEAPSTEVAVVEYANDIPF